VFAVVRTLAESHDTSRLGDVRGGAAAVVMSAARTSSGGAGDRPAHLVAAGSHTARGKFHPNEDRTVTFLDVRAHLPLTAAAPHAAFTGPVTLMLLADGHDGHACAEFVVASGSAFLRALDAVASAARSEDDWRVLLTATFEAVEGAWIANVAASKRAIPPRRAAAVGGYTSGACLTAVVLTQGEVFAANVGDCRAVWRSARGECAVLTEDHRCVNEVSASCSMGPSRAHSSSSAPALQLDSLRLDCTTP
jgi:serine/threonine protein phosphatase PrpC